VLREALQQAAGGIFLGVPAAVVATQLLASQLYGVSPGSLPHLVAAALVLLAALALAAFLPARRASRLDPISVLRGE
jgi:ABC-type antimicrobial peptide transport system permease subunit